MTRRRAAYLLVLALGFWAVFLGGEAGLITLLGGVAVMIVAAPVAFLYLVRTYRRLGQPRPRFFRMVLEGQLSKIALGGWIGYLSIARLSQRLHANGAINWEIPAPPPSISAPISALVVIVALMPPVYYAYRIWSERRAAQRDVATDLPPEL